MKKNFTKLVCVGVSCFFILSTMAQEGSASIKITDENLFIEKDINLRAEADGSFIYFWPDSTIDYNNFGEPIHKKYYDKTNQTCMEGSLENGSWIFSAPESSNGYPVSNGKISYEKYEQSNVQYFILYYPIMLGTGSYTIGIGGGLQFETYNNSKGNPTLVQTKNDDTIEDKLRLEYNENDDINYIEYMGGQVQCRYKYDEYGRLCLFESYFNDGLGARRIAKYNKEGQLVSVHYQGWNNGYTLLYYSDETDTPNVEIDNNTPISNENQGNFDLNINISIDSIGSGSLTITFPDGFMLDERNTSLTLDYANLFVLTITKQENNSWLLEIKPKTLRSASLRADEAKKMLQVVYTVDEILQRGIYDISVNSILFETKGGNYIPEPSIIVPAIVERWGVSNETINILTHIIYTDYQTINIHTANAERIAIYSIMGYKLYETEIQSGLNAINAANFPKGILIIKGSSGWSKKLINK